MLDVSEDGIILTEELKSIGIRSVKNREIDDLIDLNNETWKRENQIIQKGSIFGIDFEE